MADDTGNTGETLIGVAGIGAGILLLFGALKNVSIFGRQGLLATVIRTGQFPDLDTLPPMFASFSKIAAVGPVANQIAVEAAFLAMAEQDPVLTGQLRAALTTWNPKTDPSGNAAFVALLNKADKEGGQMATGAGDIRRYMAGVVASAATSATTADTTVPSEVSV